MERKAQKRASIPAKDNAGWLRSFISIFEFSQSYKLRKLLVDRKYKSARYCGTSLLSNNLSEDTLKRKHEDDANPDGCEDTIALSRLRSVKTLIEEEMSKERTSKDFSCMINSNQKMTKNHRNDSDPRINDLLDSTYVVLEQFKCREQVEGSNLIFDLAALMIEFYSVNRNFSDIFKEIEVDLCGPLRSIGHRKHSNFDEFDSQLAYKQNSMIQEALVIEAEAFLSQKINDTKRLVGNGVIHSQEFMDALEILNSNKELFLKLVQDPNSLAFSHIQQLLKPQVADFSKLEAVDCLKGSDHSEEELENSDQNRKSLSNQMPCKLKQHFLSKKKDKFRWETASKIRNTSEEMSRMVVLKSHIARNHDGSTQHSACLSSQSNYSKHNEEIFERTVSLFSFREIKRKLRYIIGDRRKQQHLISKDSFTRIPFGYKGSADTCSVTSTENSKTNVTSTENIYQSFLSDSKAEKKPMVTEMQQKIEAETAQCKIQGLSQISFAHAESLNEENSEKHLSEMISNDYSATNLKNNQISDSLEKIISPSDFKLLKLQLIDDTKANLILEQSLKETPCISDELDVEMPVINTEAANDRVGLQEETCNGEQPKAEGLEEIVAIENVKSVQTSPAKECNTLHIPDSSSCESFEDRCSTPSEQGTPIEKPRILIPTASISQSSLIINHFDSSIFIEKPERPSPVSVLEPFFLEDDASPDRPNTKSDELHKPMVQPIHLNFHEDSAFVITTSNCLISHQNICSYDMEIMTKYVRTMLETFSFDSEMIPERWPSSELLLHPPLSDELNSLQSSYPEDPKLLLDCVNEVLSDVKVRQFRISPLLSSFQPTVQPFLKEIIVQEVCRTIKSHLNFQVQSPTINEMMMKDMDSAMWMDHRLEMECSIADMDCDIFEELMEETIFELFLSKLL